MDLSILGSEEIIGGIFVIIAGIYGVHKKLKADGVETVNQKAEINVIEALIKQRDDALTISDGYREKLMLNEDDLRELHNKINQIEIEKLKLLEKIDQLEAESTVLRDIIEYLTDTVSITRKSIENKKED